MRKTFIITILLVVAFFLGITLVQAKPDKDTDGNLPQVSGTYDVPGHPNLKLRVFVHGPKVKPEPSVLPSLVCNPDPTSDAVVDSAGWHLPTGQWVYRLNTASVPSSVGSSNLSTLAQLAFGAWQNVSNGKVAFVAGSPTTVNRAKYDGQNIIAWGRTSGSALAVTYTWYYPSTGVVAETDTIMNLKFPWSWTDQSSSQNCADANSYDAQDILTHELGHWMGLDDEYTSAYVDNTMYGYGSKGEVKKDTLTTGDIAGVGNIY
jgi:hypothetical protein